MIKSFHSLLCNYTLAGLKGERCVYEGKQTLSMCLGLSKGNQLTKAVPGPEYEHSDGLPLVL